MPGSIWSGWLRSSSRWYAAASGATIPNSAASPCSSSGTSTPTMAAPCRPSRSAAPANASATSGCMGSSGAPLSTPILNPSTPRSRLREYCGTGLAEAEGSSGSGPARTSRAAALPATVAVRGSEVVERPRQRGHPGARHPPVGGLEPYRAAQRRRDADRAAGVAAYRHGHDPGCHRRARAAARPAGYPVQVPGIGDRRAVDAARQLVGGRLAHDDRAAAAQAPHQRGVGRGLRRRVGGRAAPGGQPGYVDYVLDPDRHAHQGAEVASRLDRLVGGVGRGQGAVGIQGHEGGQLAVEGGRGGQAGLGEGAAGGAARAQRPCGLRDRGHRLVRALDGGRLGRSARAASGIVVIG